MEVSKVKVSSVVDSVPQVSQVLMVNQVLQVSQVPQDNQASVLEGKEALVVKPVLPDKLALELVPKVGLEAKLVSVGNPELQDSLDSVVKEASVDSLVLQASLDLEETVALVVNLELLGNQDSVLEVKEDSVVNQVHQDNQGSELVAKLDGVLKEVLPDKLALELVPMQAQAVLELTSEVQMLESDSEALVLKQDSVDKVALADKVDLELKVDLEAKVDSEDMVTAVVDTEIKTLPDTNNKGTKSSLHLLSNMGNRFSAHLTKIALANLT